MKLSNNFFWYFLVPVLVGITLIISLSPWFFEWLATPTNQVFSGINRWSGDYFTYLSYVELGRRGELGAKLLATTLPQMPVFAHLAHTLPGYIFGHILGLNSILSYHLARSLYGLIFVFLCLAFFYRLTKNKTITLIAFWLVFYIPGFLKINSLNPFRFSRYMGWLQEQNIIGRATGPLHYNAGFIFFILTVLWWFTAKTSPIKKIVIAGLLLNLTLLSNPFAFLILALTFGLYSFFLIVGTKKLRGATAIIWPFLSTLPLFIYNQYFLSQVPWGNLGNAPAYYIVTHPPIGFWETAMSIGPIFFLGIGGIILLLARNMRLFFTEHSALGRSTILPNFFALRSKQKDVCERNNIFFFLISWLLVQFFLFFFGDYVRLDPLRSFNGLYYLPLALFSAIFIYSLFPRFKHWLLAMIILSIITFPNFYLSYKEQLFAFTDFKSFSTFTYPTIKQVEAFKFLEKNTPVGSGVLAYYEASFLLIGFSGNSTEANMNPSLKTPFYSNQLDSQAAYDFLKKNHFQYVYFGYQEQSLGGSMKKYPFLKKIFENDEVRIYQVL